MSSSLEVKYSEKIKHHDSHRSVDKMQEIVPSTSISFDTLQQLVNQTDEAHKTVAALTNLGTNPPISAAQLQESLAFLSTTIAKTRTFIGDLWDIVPAHHKPSARSKIKANEVFEVPELLEHILLELQPADILRAQQVGRLWRDCVNGSIKLKRALLLEIDEDGHYYSPFERRPDKWHGPHAFPGLEYRPGPDWDPWIEGPGLGRRSLRGVSNKWTFSLILDLNSLPPRGTRCQEMYICQPPIRKIKMQFRNGVDNERQVYHDTTWIFTDDLNLSDLHEIVDKELKNEQWAPREDRSKMKVWFVGTITLRDDDPIVLDREERHRRAVEQDEMEKAAGRGWGGKGFGSSRFNW